MDSKVSFPHCMMFHLKSCCKIVQVHAYIMYDHNILFGLHNQCYCWILLEKWCRIMLILCMTTIYCSDYIIDVIVEFLSKNSIGNIYTLPYLEKLPYLVSLIVKQTSPLNSHWKMVQIHAHIMYDHNILFGLHNQCYSWIPLKKRCWKHINTSIFGEITISG